jgi:hypothetical protein
MIYSNDEVLRATLPSGVGQPVQGAWHSHPVRGDAKQQMIDRYPSPGDWDALVHIGGQSGATANPSLWITGPDGVTREFSLSDLAFFKSMEADRTRMENGEGLAGRERTQACG